MKVTVLRRLQGNGEVYYVSAGKNHKGVYEHFTAKQVEGNPERFDVRESGSYQKKTNIRESALHPALKELNEIIATLTPLRPNRTTQQITVEAQKMYDEKRRAKLKESWQKRGLSPEAAAVAARQQTAMAPPASDLEFWSKFKF